MKIKELTFDETNEESGILAISFVEFPAIEKDFNYFNSHKFLKTKGIDLPDTPTRRMVQLKNPNGTWKYWKMATSGNETPILDNSHDFCKVHAFGSTITGANKGIYTIEEINNWHTHPDAKYDKGWMTESNYTQNFDGKSSNFNLDQQIFNCRHFLTPVIDTSELTQAGITFNSQRQQKFSVNFSVQNTEQRIVKGVAMIPNMLIYRRNPITKEEYYVFFTRETIKKLKNKYGFNREITIQHSENITGNAILLDSYIYPDDKDDKAGYSDLKEGSWIVSYKILNNKLWDFIKKGDIKGFSVELLLPVKE